LLLELPSFDTLLANAAVSFNDIWNAASCVIAHFEIVIVILQFCVFSLLRFHVLMGFILSSLFVSAFISLLFLLFL